MIDSKLDSNTSTLYLEKNKPTLHFIDIFFYLATFSISFDIFLTLNFNSFNVRIAQLLVIVPILFSFLHVLVIRKIKPVLGFEYLIIWSFFIFIFIPNTTFILRNVGYALWLLFNILLVFSMVQLLNTYDRVIKLVRVYIKSFLFVGLFGLIQFVLSTFKIASPLVTQWWYSNIPRINGFSYEPSYFSTYMLIGWILVSYLRETKSKILSRQNLNITYFIITISLILSSSRMGWIMMFLWYLRYFFIFIKKIVIKSNINFKTLLIIYIFICSLIIISIILLYFDYIEKFKFLFNGLGLFGTANHSVGERLENLINTFLIFLNSPIIGYSLGGIAPAIGALHHVYVDNNEIAKMYEGMSIFIEVLAASGVIGFIPFIIYIKKLIISPMKLSKKISDEELKKILYGLSLSLLFILLILQMNQNILRPYLWFHIAILSTAYSIALKINKVKQITVSDGK